MSGAAAWFARKVAEITIGACGPADRGAGYEFEVHSGSARGLCLGGNPELGGMTQ